MKKREYFTRVAGVIKHVFYGARIAAAAKNNPARLSRGYFFEFCWKFLCGGDYSPGMIASLGQTSAHEPHSMQVSGSMW